jgi:hypothetical protein
MALIVFVLARWISGPNFHPVAPSGPPHMTRDGMFFTDADGHSWVERGVGYVAKSPRMQTLLRFLAVFGFVQVSKFVLFTIPIQWVGLMSDP